MTIKDVAVEGKGPTREGVDNVITTNQEANYAASYTNYDTIDDNIPMVAATVVLDNPSPLDYNNNVPLDDKPSSTDIENPAPTTNDPPPAADNALMVTTQPINEYPMGQGAPLPTGARWITIKHVGGVTWTLCTLISILTCCIVLCPCGLWAFACPCDEIRAYEVNGQVYDEHGRPLGHISKFRTL
jgi:hypothetical protein